MMKRRGILLSALVAVAGVVLSLGGVTTPAVASGSLNAYVSQPFVQGPPAGSEVETFDSTCPTTWWANSGNEGTMTGTCVSVGANWYGGSSSTSPLPVFGGGLPLSTYAAVYGAQTFTVSLQSPVSYLGFWWSAGDPGNLIVLYSGDVEVARFTTDDLLAMLYYGETGEWSSNDYFYSPAHGNWVGEPFAYIHLVGVNGLTFDKFTVSETCCGGFEFDNFAIQNGPVSLDPATVIPIGDETIPDANDNGIPDTSEDTDGDGIADPFEDNNGDGVSDVLQDTDGDGVSNWVEAISLPDTGVSPAPLAAASVLLLLVGGVLLAVRRRRSS